MQHASMCLRFLPRGQVEMFQPGICISFRCTPTQYIGHIKSHANQESSALSVNMHCLKLLYITAKAREIHFRECCSLVWECLNEKDALQGSHSFSAIIFQDFSQNILNFTTARIKDKDHTLK